MSKTLTLAEIAIIKDVIKRKDLKKKALAKAIGITPESFSAILGRKRGIGSSAKILLFQKLELNESDKAAS